MVHGQIEQRGAGQRQSFDQIELEARQFEDVAVGAARCEQFEGRLTEIAAYGDLE